MLNQYGDTTQDDAGHAGTQGVRKDAVRAHERRVVQHKAQAHHHMSTVQIVLHLLKEHWQVSSKEYQANLWCS